MYTVRMLGRINKLQVGAFVGGRGGKENFRVSSIPDQTSIARYTYVAYLDVKTEALPSIGSVNASTFKEVYSSLGTVFLQVSRTTTQSKKAVHVYIHVIERRGRT